MENEIYYIDGFKKTRGQKVKVKIKDASRKTANWCYRNKDLLIVIVPASMGLATASIKAIGKHVKFKREKNLKDLYCYDRSLGHYWRLRRELSNSEWVEIDKRKANGERLADILSELKVLK